MADLALFLHPLQLVTLLGVEKWAEGPAALAGTVPIRSHRRLQKLSIIANGYSRSSTMLGDSRPTPNPHRPLGERVI